MNSMFTLDLLTKAADLVETQDKQKRLLESPSPKEATTEGKKTNSNHISEPKSHNEHELNGITENRSNGTAENRRHDHVIQNGSTNGTSKGISGAESTRTVKNHDGKDNKDDVKFATEIKAENRPTFDFLVHQQRLAEQANGLQQAQARLEKFHRTEENLIRQSPERFQRRSTSPAPDRGGDKHSATKPMVLLHQPTANTLPSVGPASTASLTNPAALHASTMHHPYLYSLMYPSGATALDPGLGALARVPGGMLKEGEGQTSSPNGSPNAGLAAATAGLHFPTGLMYPFANQALLMGARPPGAVADISPLLLAPSSAAGYPVLDQYKRLFEGMQQQIPAYSLQPQLTDQYLKTVGHALEGNKDALALSALAGRLPPGLSLAAIQGQPGVAEAWLRYPEQFSAAMGILRPQDGLSPRAGSPYGGKRRTDSPIIANGSKIATSTHPFGFGQPQISSLNDARAHTVRSPAAAIFSQGHRSRSPATEARKPEVDRSNYRSHSRDLDREAKPTPKDLALASTTANHIRMNNEHLAANSFSVTDRQTGRPIPIPLPSSFYDSSGHLPPGYSLGFQLRQPAQTRTPSPRSRAGEERYHRPSRDRSPEAKRRSLDGQYIARNSPLLNDRHNSRPTSPTPNGLPASSRPQLPLVNGSAETAVAAAAANPHLLLSSNHTRSPNASAFGAEVREARSGSPAANPSYLAGVPYLPQHILGGLAGAAGSQLLFPPYAQALAAKGADLAALYKHGEGTFPLSLLTQQQQQLLAGARPPYVLQEYAAALKANPYLLTQPGVKESGKASPANSRDKIPGMPQPIHHSLLAQHPPQAVSPSKVGLKPKHSPSPQLAKQGMRPHAGAESHSPPGVGSTALAPADARRYQSPNVDRPGREGSPSKSKKPYRPNPMLRQHAEDLERSRKRKILEEERAEREFQDSHHNIHGRPDQRDNRNDPKRRKQLISEADPDEHFRRALGNDYESKTTNKVHISGNVDDHFKKALGPGYENIQSKASKSDAAPHNPHVLPTYSAAIASFTQTPKVYPPPHHPDGKEAIPSRLYDPAFLARERHMHMLNPQHRKLGEKSPPRVSAPPGPTVSYPTNPPPIGPVRQKVKAKAFIPEAPNGATDLANSNRSARSNSLGSKGSSRTISGSSADSLPTTVTKSPTSSPTSSAIQDSRPSVLPVISTIPYTYAHQQNTGVSTAIAANIAASVAVTEGIAPQRIRSSPTSPPRGSASEEVNEKQTSPRISASQEQRERSISGEGKLSS